MGKKAVRGQRMWLCAWEHVQETQSDGGNLGREVVPPETERGVWHRGPSSREDVQYERAWAYEVDGDTSNSRVMKKIRPVKKHGSCVPGREVAGAKLRRCEVADVWRGTWLREVWAGQGTGDEALVKQDLEHHTRRTLGCPREMA